MQIYKELLAYAFYCHRLPDRSFIIAGRQFPICSRCSGIVIGYITGLIATILGFRVSVVFLLLLPLPLIVDGIGQYCGIWISNNCRRFLTGISFGFSLILIAYLLIAMGYSHGHNIGIELKPYLGKWLNKTNW